MNNNVVLLDNFRANSFSPSQDAHDHSDEWYDAKLPQDEITRLENIRDCIEETLNQLTATHCDPAAVSFAAGRFATMNLFKMQGRAQTMAFFDKCIETLEIEEDMFGTE